MTLAFTIIGLVAIYAIGGYYVLHEVKCTDDALNATINKQRDLE